MHNDERDRVSRQGADAWRRLKKEKNYNDWIKVGEALQVGREWAMNQVKVNKPEGKGYNMCFGEWLQRFKLDDMDKGDRSRLFAMMEALPQIEQWRQTLTLTERLKLNHPHVIMRKFKSAFEIPGPEKPAKPTLRDSVAELSEENAQLKAENEELKAHIDEIAASAATDGSKTDGSRDKVRLLWVASAMDEKGYRRLQAPVSNGVYDIKPRYQVQKHKKKFIGYDANFVTMDCVDPNNAVDEDNDVRQPDSVRMKMYRLAVDVQDEAEAKAIAQADYDRGR